MKKTYNSLIIFTLIAIILLILAIVGPYVISMLNTSSLPTQTLCTQDAKRCPDGSYVGRTGPHCEFSLCPHTTSKVSTTSSTTTDSGATTKISSGIMGTVFLGPICPVMRNPPDPRCADKPYNTSLVITTVDGTEVIARFSSDAAGKFRVPIVPGEYIIQSGQTSMVYPRCSSTGVITVKEKIFTLTNIYCDTGIR